MKTSFGNYIRCYDKEKTICDIITHIPLNQIKNKIFIKMVDLHLFTRRILKFI